MNDYNLVKIKELEDKIHDSIRNHEKEVWDLNARRHRLENNADLKEGDKVKIVINTGASRGDEAIGKEATVLSVHNGYLVLDWTDSDGVRWTWEYDEVEKIEKRDGDDVPGGVCNECGHTLERFTCINELCSCYDDEDEDDNEDD